MNGTKSSIKDQFFYWTFIFETITQFFYYYFIFKIFYIHIKLLYEIKTLAENNNIHIITLDNAINTIEGNTSMFSMYAWMYEQESQHISDKIKYALKSRAEKGIFKC